MYKVWLLILKLCFGSFDRRLQRELRLNGMACGVCWIHMDDGAVVADFGES